MNLYLLRHGIAMAGDQEEVDTDSERPLSSKGTKRMRKIAKGLKRLEIPFDAVLTSPLIRARKTAEIVAQTIGLEAYLQEISGLAPESSVDNLMFGLTRFQDRKHLLLVGHEPLLSGILSFVLAGKHGVGLSVDLKKGGLCRIEVDSIPPSQPGTLHWILAPKQLRLLGQKDGNV